jgi:hypothetical protein
LVPVTPSGKFPVFAGAQRRPSNEDRFFGVFNATGIGSISISNTSGGIEVDHLQYGVAASASVPEPSTLLLLGSGLVGLGGVAWRRFRRG